MKHERFAKLAATHLESMAASLEERSDGQTPIVTKARAHELRVAAHVVRDLSRAATRKERRSSSTRLAEKPWTIFRRQRAEPGRSAARKKKSAGVASER